MAINNALFMLCASVVFTHLASLGRERGLSSGQASGLVSALGAANTLGRLGLGAVMQLPGVRPLGLYAGLYAAAGAATLPVSFVTAVPALVVYAAVFGALSAALGTVTPEAVIAVCGVRRLAAGLGYVMVFQAAGMLLGGPAAGWVLETSQEYHGCFIMAGVAAVAGGGVVVPSWWVLGRRRR